MDSLFKRLAAIEATIDLGEFALAKRLIRTNTLEDDNIRYCLGKLAVAQLDKFLQHPRNHLPASFFADWILLWDQRPPKDATLALAGQLVFRPMLTVVFGSIDTRLLAEILQELKQTFDFLEDKDLVADLEVFSAEMSDLKATLQRGQNAQASQLLRTALDVYAGDENFQRVMGPVVEKLKLEFPRSLLDVVTLPEGYVPFTRGQSQEEQEGDDGGVEVAAPRTPSTRSRAKAARNAAVPASPVEPDSALEPPAKRRRTKRKSILSTKAKKLDGGEDGDG